MKRNRKNSLCFVALLVVSLGFALCTVPVYAGEAHKAESTVYGKTYGEWSANWWQWAFAGPDGRNPVQDLTGEFCGENQPKGKVWFLAGSFQVANVERTCTIPPGRALFYPLLNVSWTDCPNSPDATVSDADVRGILATSWGDLACQLTSTLDGTSISSMQIITVRTQSPKFFSILPENNIGSAVAGCAEPMLPGKSGRQISEGYWIMLPPLSPGEHVLTLHGAGCDTGTGNVLFENGVTYKLTVLGGNHKDDE